MVTRYGDIPYTSLCCQLLSVYSLSNGISRVHWINLYVVRPVAVLWEPDTLLYTYVYLLLVIGTELSKVLTFSITQVVGLTCLKNYHLSTRQGWVRTKGATLSIPPIQITSWHDCDKILLSLPLTHRFGVRLISLFAWSRWILNGLNKEGQMTSCPSCL